MGAHSADGIAPRRSKLRAYLLLARVSNLPTVWTNVLAAYVIAGASFDSLLIASLSLSLFYTGGMFLNDAFDARFDSHARPDRPIPNGDASQREVFIIGFALLAIGESLLVLQPFPTRAARWGLALAAAIVFYDYAHKDKLYGPIVMGLCRALVYLVAASSATGIEPYRVVGAASVMMAYVMTLTYVAKLAGRGDWVPWLIAGICIVDAIFITMAGGGPVAATVAIAGFIVTLALQRVVPGT
ncbi:MAG TPA: UbiA family prenyltransferase [Vicinamibacterales bacterium]|nr:UbiA family prenyltransferase [Vicinamibacterales bacterium]